jgi:hypothetical protein
MAWMVKRSKDVWLRLIRHDPVPKAVDTKKIEGEEDEVEDGVPIKHCWEIKPDNSPWVINTVWRYG